MASSADEKEYVAFVQAIRHWLQGEAFRLCGDWHEAEDLVQVALWKLYQRWNQLERRAELGAYARRVVLHNFLSQRRTKRWQREVVIAVAPDATQTLVVHNATDDRGILLPALRRLGPRQRAVVTMRFLADLSVEQTALALGCTPGTVTSQTARALKTLRRLLDSGRMQCSTGHTTRRVRRQ